MKDTGIVRNIDSLGRLVIPKEMRKTLDIAEKDPVEFFSDGNKIVLRKYAPNCIFCGSEYGITEYAEKNVCAECIERIKRTL